MTSPLTAVGQPTNHKQDQARQVVDQLTAAKLREILLGCEGVTPGPWCAGPQAHYDDDVELYTTEPFTDQIGTLICDGMNAEHDAKINAAHIARLDPGTVKELCRLALIGLEASRSPVPEGDGLRPTHRHVKRGSEYVLIGYGKMQAEKRYRRHGMENAVDVDMAEVAIYRSATDPTEIWVRPREEFEDGRFVALASPAPVKAEAEVVAAWAYQTPSGVDAVGEYDNWQWRISLKAMTDAPVGTIRNLQPLRDFDHATPSSGGRREALEEQLRNVPDEQIRHIAESKDVASCRGRIVDALANTNPTGAE